MLKIVFAAALLGTLGAISSNPAAAADGCSYDPYGQLYCQPGARPGVPYGYQGYGGGYDDRLYQDDRRYYRRGYNDAAIALGIVGAVTSVIIAGQRRGYTRNYNRRRR